MYVIIPYSSVLCSCVLLRKRLGEGVGFDDPKDMSYHIVERIVGGFVYTEQNRQYR